MVWVTVAMASALLIVGQTGRAGATFS